MMSEMVLHTLFNVDILTGESCSKVLQTIVQTLLFQRHQIPFSYQLFKNIMIKIKAGMAGIEEYNLKSYKLTKQRKLAVKTLDELQKLFKDLSAIENSKQNVQAMVLFGATIYTAKEAFVINLPLVNFDHYAQHHRQGIDSALKHLTKQIILAEELCPSGKFMGPTKTFVLLGLTPTHGTDHSWITQGMTDYKQINSYKLPISCQKYVININIRQMSNKGPICCKKMSIFNDYFQSMQLEHEERVCTDEKQKNVFEHLGTIWYQIGKGVKGYKDVLINGKTIWDDGL